MTFKQIVFLYIITLAVFVVIDMIWLGVVAKSFYRRHLGSLMSPKVNWISAILFYLLFIVGLLVFVIRRHTVDAIQPSRFLARPTGLLPLRGPFHPL